MKVKRGIEILYLLASIIMLLFLVVLLIGTVSYWNTNLGFMNNQLPTTNRLFNVALLIALVTVIVEWTEGRIQAIIKILKGGKNGDEIQTTGRTS